MINARNIYVLYILYFAILLLLAPSSLLSLDTYYYWEWSRHLALSYYDGSPMIAYIIRLSTLLFGDSLFALSFIGIVVTAATSAIIYKTARFFLSKEASWVAMLSWLFSPLTTLDLLKQTTYDTPLTLFWALTLYYTSKFIQKSTIKNCSLPYKELYFIGASAGLMMLSKYTGIVLILSLLVFLLISRYRSLFKTKHFYFSVFLSIFIFSPVIFWNYQNQWQSFIYQLTFHQLSHSVNSFYNVVKTFLSMFLPALNLMLIPPFWVDHTSSSEQTKITVKLYRTVCIVFLCFYIYAASKTEIRVYWLTPYLISSALLLGYCFEKFLYRKLIVSLMSLYGLISLCILIDNTLKFHVTTSKKLISYHLIQQFNSVYPQLPKTILTSGWFEARILYFLKNKPAIYTLGCGSAQNQYAFWSADINKKIEDKTLKEALFIDSQDKQNCLNNYFDRCEKMPTKPYSYKHKRYDLYVYKCINF